MVKRLRWTKNVQTKKKHHRLPSRLKDNEVLNQIHLILDSVLDRSESLTNIE